MVDDRRDGSDHAEPDPGKVPEVEDVVELCRRRHHLRLGREPKHPRDRDQLLGQEANVFRETAAVGKAKHSYEVKILTDVCFALRDFDTLLKMRM